MGGMTDGRTAAVRDLLMATAERAAEFLESLDKRDVGPAADLEELRRGLDVELQDEPRDPAQVLDELVTAADPGVVAMPGGRYFGFVIGGSLPAAVAADWMTTAWDQNAGLYIGGPAAAVAEETAGRWLLDLLRLPPTASFAVVTGAQMANFTGLAAARHHLLAKVGWDVNRDGLFGAPRLRVLVGADRHVTIDRALRYLGIGTAAVDEVATDAGRMDVDHLRELLGDDPGPTIVCTQAGEVNTGAFDPIGEICAVAQPSGAWVHVDGAFGLWAAVDEERRHLVAGLDRADSWTTDGHKWLNVPYDCGLAFCAHPDAHRAAMAVRADYLVHSDAAGGPREQMDWNPEFSRRARGFALYAALRSLGRSGISDLVSRCCAHATTFATELAQEPGIEILNDVVLNQVLVRFGDDDAHTLDVIQRIQAGGECFMTGTVWEGEQAMRISVVNWQTSADDVRRSIAAIVAAHRG